MNFRLYAARHAWLAVPDCMHAPQAAVDRFGPLEFRGEIDQRELSEQQAARLEEDIDADSFAVVPEPLALRLQRSLAREHA